MRFKVLSYGFGFPTLPPVIVDIGCALDWLLDVARRLRAVVRRIGELTVVTFVLVASGLIFTYALLSEDALIGQAGVHFAGVDAPVLAEWNQEQQADAFKATSLREW